MIWVTQKTKTKMVYLIVGLIVINLLEKNSKDL